MEIKPGLTTSNTLPGTQQAGRVPPALESLLNSNTPQLVEVISSQAIQTVNESRSRTYDVLLKLGSGTIATRSDFEVSAGDKLLIQAVNLQQIKVLEHILSQPTASTLPRVSLQALSATIEAQQPASFALNNLSSYFTQLLPASQPASPQVLALANQWLSQIPDLAQITQPGMLQQKLINSGEFLESRLGQLLQRETATAADPGAIKSNTGANPGVKQPLGKQELVRLLQSNPSLLDNARHILNQDQKSLLVQLVRSLASQPQIANLPLTRQLVAMINQGPAVQTEAPSTTVNVTPAQLSPASSVIPTATQPANLAATSLLTGTPNQTLLAAGLPVLPTSVPDNSATHPAGQDQTRPITYPTLTPRKIAAFIANYGDTPSTTSTRQAASITPGSIEASQQWVQKILVSASELSRFSVPASLQGSPSSSTLASAMSNQGSSPGSIPVSTSPTLALPLTISFARYFMQDAASLSSTASASSDQYDLATSTLLRQLAASIARIQHNQLASVLSSGQGVRGGDQTQPATTSWLIDLPVHHQGQFNTVNLRIDEDRHSENTQTSTQKERQWTVTLGFNFDDMGEFFATFTLRRQHISTTFWSERQSTLDCIRRDLNQLKEKLGSLGLEVRQMNCRRGHPPTAKTRFNQSLVDIQT